MVEPAAAPQHSLSSSSPYGGLHLLLLPPLHMPSERRDIPPGRHHLVWNGRWWPGVVAVSVRSAAILSPFPHPPNTRALLLLLRWCRRAHTSTSPSTAAEQPWSSPRIMKPLVRRRSLTRLFVVVVLVVARSLLFSLPFPIKRTTSLPACLPASAIHNV